MSYLRGLPEPLASKADAELLLGDTRLPVHTQIVSLHSAGEWQGGQRGQKLKCPPPAAAAACCCRRSMTAVAVL